MEIKLAQPEHIDALLNLLNQVGQVHHEIRPDIFKKTCLKYDETALLELLKDENKPIFVAEEEQGITGKAVTPFLLARVKDLTGGDSLEANIALVKNNAKLAAEVAAALCW